jgi:hypothetical protein
MEQNARNLRHRHGGDPDNCVTSTEADYKEIKCAPDGGLMRRACMHTFVAFVIHYLLWWPAFLLGLCFLFWYVGGGWLGLVVVALPLIAYAPSFLDNSQFKLGRPWHWVRLLSIWNLAHSYLDLRVIRTAKLDAHKTYVFGWHPHGIIILSRLVMYGGIFDELFPGIDVRALGASPMFYWPGAREISLWLGAVDASKRTAQKVLAANKSVIVYPGGSKEIFLTDEKSTRTSLQLKDRQGFIALAMEQGADLVPVVIYNERSAYTRVTIPAWLKNFCLKKLKLPAVLFYGRFFSLMPKRTQLGVVFGAPIPVVKVPGVQKNSPEVQALLNKVPLTAA